MAIYYQNGCCTTCPNRNTHICNSCPNRNGGYVKAPTGPPGSVGIIEGTANSLEALQAAKPAGAGGNYYLIGNNLYAFDADQRQWKNMAMVGGPTGDAGQNGAMPQITVTPNGNWSINGFDTGVPAGATGPAPTLSIGPNGNWIVNGVDSGISAQGPAGDRGGRSVVAIGPNGNWTVNGADSSSTARGITGAIGATGTMPTYTIGANGNYIVNGVDSGVSRRSIEGDTGTQGATGTLVGSYNSINELQAAHPTGLPGEHFLINRDVYGFAANENRWVRIGPLGGPTGPTGPNGTTPTVAVGPNGNFLVNGNDSGISSRGATGITGPTGSFVGSFPTVPALQAARPTGLPGEFYLINREVYGFDPNTNSWRDIGPLGGPPGPMGPSGPAGTIPNATVTPDGNWLINGADTGRSARGATGEPGAIGTIVGSYPSQAVLQAAQPNGPQGVYYLVGPDLYGYNPDTRQWFRIGPIAGPTGPAGGVGRTPQIVPGENGNWFISGADSGSSSRGPTGPKGPTGAIKGAYPTPADLQAARPTGPAGNFYLVGTNLYTFDPGTNSWKNVGSIAGPPGPAGGTGAEIPVTIGPNGNFFANGNDTGMTSRGATGATGPTGTFVGGYPSLADLQRAHLSGKPGEYYLVNRKVYGFDPATNSWKEVGPMGGPTGPQGPAPGTGAMPDVAIGPNGNWTIGGTDTTVPARGATGEAGVVSTILGSYPTQGELQAAHPNGPEGVYYLVGENLMGYDPDTRAWFRIGPIGGPPGPQGPAGGGPAVTQGPNGNWFIGNRDTGVPYKGPTGPTGGASSVKVGPNGNWYIGTNDTGIPAKGPTGPSGTSGPPGTAEISPDGTWIINGTPSGPSRGPTGATGGAGSVRVGTNGNWIVNGTDSGVPVKGPTGATGGTPPITIGPNGNWFVGPKDTGVPAKGATGAPGGMPRVTVGPEGNWYIDGVNTTVPRMGAKGAQGPPGPTGATGVMDIGPNGNFITNGTDSLVSSRGRTGPTGPSPAVTIGTNGNWFVDGKDTNLTSRPTAGATGPTGATATVPVIAPGPNGNWFIDGKDSGMPERGATGADGAAGATGGMTIGPNGNWFNNGTDTKIPAHGPTGATGPQGGTPAVTVGDNGNWYIDGVDTGVPKKGPTGPTGATPNVTLDPATQHWFIDGKDNGSRIGPTGATGAPGAPGPTGAAPTVTIWPNGNWAIDGADTGVPRMGPAGSAGAAGAAGARGATGPTGANGITGPTGPTGDPGPPGPAGAGGMFGNAATFQSTQGGTYSGGSPNSGVVLPLKEQTTTVNPAGFELNSDGTVTVKKTGTYLASALVQQSAGDSNSFAIQVNGTGIGAGANQYNSFATHGGGDARGFLSTSLQLKEGDRVSVGLVSPGPVTLKTNPGGTPQATSTVKLSLVQVA